MSGITPLIDTLLNQVLGRQGEVSLQRALNQAVKPIPPGEGPRAVLGDANLDGRASTPLSDLKRLPLPLDGGRTPPRGDALPSPPGSTQTHFSPAARTIADVLLRFPAPPSVMRPEAPLITSQETPGVSTVATRLEASIRDSGLFYESHLKRWFQGEGTRQQLLNEPQMQPGPRPLAPLLPSGLGITSSLTGLVPWAMSGAQAGGQGGVSILPNVPLVPMSHENGLARPGVATSAQAAASSQAAVSTQVTAPPQNPPAPVAMASEGRESSQARAEYNQAREMNELIANRPARDIVHESLQNLVRQQLEMLVMPTVRWEGDVWAGIFMALVINLPTREEGQEGKQQEGEPDGGWRSEMQLDVPQLGSFSASLWLYKNVLSIDFTTENKQAYQRIEAGLPALEKRLSALDLQNVQLRARYTEAEETHGYSE